MEHTTFSKEVFATFRSLDRPGPVQLLNLIKLRQSADYPDGRNVSGREAYETYSRISAPVLARLGGRIAWRGAFDLTMIGPSEEAWDICFVAEYPSVEAFIALMRDATYQEAMTHRQAGVADCRLVSFAPMPFGVEFGERHLDSKRDPLSVPGKMSEGGLDD